MIVVTVTSPGNIAATDVPVVDIGIQNRVMVAMAVVVLLLKIRQSLEGSYRCCF